jgi:ATP-dependent RNA helicase DeaD
VVLKRFGYDADELSADLSQSAREKVLSRVREGSLRFLVATDVAARGIDIPELSHVILYEQPEDPESYIHRSGRTGRAGASGQAISLVAGSEQSTLLQIDRRYKIGLLEQAMPTDEDVQGVVSERVTALLEARLRKRDSLQTERMRRFIPLARTLGQTDEEASIVAMLLDDYYQEVLHAAPPVPEEAPRPAPAAQPPYKPKGSGRRRKR